jgi:hypothetical protein
VEADHKVALLIHLAADTAGFPDLSGRPLSRAKRARDSTATTGQSEASTSRGRPDSRSVYATHH